jgi:hypothetical protein
MASVTKFASADPDEIDATCAALVASRRSPHRDEVRRHLAGMVVGHSWPLDTGEARLNGARHD